MEPRSPWQILVARRAEETGATTRSLAAAISTRDQAISNGTVWTWMRCNEGCPPGTSYTPQINAALAKALHIPAIELSAAYDASRARFVPSSTPDGSKRLIHLRRLVADSPSTSWSKPELLTLIDEILNL